MKKNRLLSRILVALCAVALVLVGFLASLPRAWAQEENSTPHVSLLIYISSSNELASLMLLSDDEATNSFSMISIPLNTRSIISTPSGMAYAPIYQAYDGTSQSLDAIVEAVEYLIQAPSITRVIALDDAALCQIVNNMGGVRVQTSDLPPADYLTGSQEKPEDNLSRWLSARQNRLGTLSGYHMASASLLAGFTPRVLNTYEAKTTLLTGELAVKFCEYTVFPAHNGTDIMQLKRHQNLFLSLVGAVRVSGAIDTQGVTLLKDEGEPTLISRLARFDSRTLSAAAGFPSGSDREYAGEIHWVFDTVWLREWVMRYGLGII